MSDTPIDKLTIEIDAESKKACDKIDDLHRKIGKLESSIGSLDNKKPAGIKDLQKATENASRAVSDLESKYKDLGKGFTLKGDATQIQKEIDKLSNALARATLKREMLETSGNISGKMYEYAIRDAQMFANQIESLKNQLSDLSNIKPIDDMDFPGLRKAKEEVEDIAEELRASFVPIESLQYNADAMAAVFGESARNIKEYSQAEAMLGEKAGMRLNAGVLSDRIEPAKDNILRLQKLLDQLIVPDVKTDNIDKLTSSIERAETKLEELRIKLYNEIVMGSITESIDDKGYVRLQEQIAITEKKLESLRIKKEEVEKNGFGIGKFGLDLKNTAKAAAIAQRGISKFGNGAKKAAGGLKDLVFQISSLGKSGKKLNTFFSGGLKKILAYGFGIRTLFTLFTKLRNSVKEGMKNLSQFSSDTNASVSLLNNSINQFKNASAAAVSPILNSLAPAINKIIQLCIKAANAVNQLISALLGKSFWIRAKNLSDDYADSLKKASSAAKGAVASFDALNIINTQDNSVESSTSPADMFEDVPIDNKWANIADWLKSMWEKADFTELGKTLGEKLKDSLDSIDWESIKESARKIGKSIATFINGFVEVDGLGYSIGKTLAEALNTALEFFNSFAENLHWESVGHFIADSINGFFLEFDWKLFATTINNWAHGLLDMVIVALEEVEWYEIGAKLGEFLSELDFAGIGKKIATAIWDAIKAAWSLIEGSFDSAPLETAVIGLLLSPKILSSIGEFVGLFANPIKNAFSMISEMIAPLSAKVAEMFSLWTGGAGTLGESFMSVFGTGGVIGIALAAFVVGLGNAYAKNEEVREGFSEAVSSIRDGLKPALGFIADTLLPDLQAGWEKLKEILSPLADFLNNVFVSAWQDMINPALKYIGETVLPMLTSAFEDLWSNVLVPLGNFLSSVLEPVIRVISDVLRMLWENVVVPLADTIGNVLSKAFEGLVEICEARIIPIMNQVIEVMQFLWDNVLSPLVDYVWGELKPVFENTFETIKSLIGSVSDVLGGLIDFITGVFSGNWEKAWNGVKEIFRGIFNGLKTIVDNVIGWILGKINSVPEKISKLTSFVADRASNSGANNKSVKIPGYASGGFPKQYSLFMAGENGIPEIAGTVGGKPAVAGGSEITGISDTIRSTSSEEIALLRQQNSLLQAILEKEFGISQNDIGKAARNYARDYSKRTGREAYSF